MSKNIFLAKKGKITGPITLNEYEAMKASGQIEQFFWIWHADMRQWVPLDPPPAPIHAEDDDAPAPRVSAHPAAIAAQAAAQVVQLKQPKIKFGSTEHIEVLCHDFRNIVQGSIQEPNALGFSLVTPEDLHAPKLGAQGKVMLNLLNKKSGQMTTVSAEVTGVARVGKSWSYQIRWGELPISFFK